MRCISPADPEVTRAHSATALVLWMPDGELVLERSL
jgi:hypothetical protein